jgi:hypothetical protein
MLLLLIDNKSNHSLVCSEVNNIPQKVRILCQNSSFFLRMLKSVFELQEVFKPPFGVMAVKHHIYFSAGSS